MSARLRCEDEGWRRRRGGEELLPLAMAHVLRRIRSQRRDGLSLYLFMTLVAVPILIACIGAILAFRFSRREKNREFRFKLCQELIDVRLQWETTAWRLDTPEDLEAADEKEMEALLLRTISLIEQLQMAQVSHAVPFLSVVYFFYLFAETWKRMLACDQELAAGDVFFSGISSAEINAVLLRARSDMTRAIELDQREGVLDHLRVTWLTTGYYFRCVRWYVSNRHCLPSLRELENGVVYINRRVA